MEYRIASLLSEQRFAKARHVYPESCDNSCKSKANLRNYSPEYISKCMLMCSVKHSFFMKAYQVVQTELEDSLRQCERQVRSSISEQDTYNTCIEASIVGARSHLRAAVDRLMPSDII
jgi:hypothetical protein